MPAALASHEAKLHVTIPADSEHAESGSEASKRTPGGSAAVTSTSVAGLGPRLNMPSW